MTHASPIIPWIGGKRRLADKIVPLFPPHVCYVELFAGAAALLYAKEPSKTEVLNDKNKELTNLYRVVKHHLREFIEQFRWALTSRTMFEWLQSTPPETLTDIHRAARFFYLQKLSFGGKVTGQTFGTGASHPHAINLLRLEEDLSAAHIRLNRVVIEELDWAVCLKRYDRPDTLFYCDPPYFKCEGYGLPFPLEEYEKLGEAIRRLQGRAVVSINDLPEMRQAFRGLERRTVDVKYTVGGGQKGKARQAKELIFVK